MSLIARHLEANGIPTVIIGSAIDIVEHCSVPRYLHTDFPLGNPCGKPYDREMQLDITTQALDLLGNASATNTTERTKHIWSENNEWRGNYSKVADSNREHLRLKGEKRRAQQTEIKASGESRAPMIS